jgi:hypothetical protein
MSIRATVKSTGAKAPGPRSPKRLTLEQEFFSPQREAAMFYGLFLRGHSADSIRAEIDISPSLFRKWMRAREWDENFRNDLQKMYQYRKQVLAIFDSLVTSEKAMSSWQ